MTSGSLSSLWDFHGEIFRKHAHQLLAWAFTDARHELTPELDEPSKTGKLAEAMQARLDTHPDTPDDYLHYCVGDQVPISPTGQTGNDRLRLDLSLVRAGIRPRISFIFEAKRLKTNAYPIGKYVSAGGLGDFIDSRYGMDCPEAAMVALYEDRDLTYWSDELRRVFAEDSKAKQPKLAIIEDLEVVNVVSDFSGELKSKHQRRNGFGPIEMYHIFLDCCVST